MRTQLLGGLALLCGALTFLCGAGVARAQAPTESSGNAFSSGKAPNPAPPQGNGPGSVTNAFYRPSPGSGAQVTPASYGYPGYGQVTQASCCAPYGQGYGYYPNYYNYYYPNYSSAYLACPPYQYPQSPPVAPRAEIVTLPALPVVPDHVGAEEAPCKKDGCCLGPDLLGHKDHFWVTAGYDASWLKPSVATTPLVTTGPLATAASPPGYAPAGLGQPGTVLLLGNRADFGLFNGVRLSAGLYLDDEDHWSLEWDGRLNIANHVRYQNVSDAGGNPLIAHPEFSIIQGVETAFADSIPGLFSGGTAIDQRSQLLGGEINCRYNFTPASHWHVDGLLGFRFLRLAESLTIRDQATPISPGVLTFEGVPLDPTDVLGDIDSFKTANHFYGLQLGTGVRWECQWLFLAASGKVAVGGTDQMVDINGTTIRYTPSGPLYAGGGIYAQPSNIGDHNRTVVGIVPEGNLTFGVKITSWLNFTAGYSFLYWNSVVRPGAQIDRVINQSMVASDVSFGPTGGPARPAFHYNDENFWVHTVTFGLDFHY